MARGDFIHVDGDVSLVTRRTGFSATVRDEFSLACQGVAWFNGDVYTAVAASNAIRRHAGFSSTVNVTISPSNPARITFDNNGDLIWIQNIATSTYRRQAGFTGTTVEVRATDGGDIVGLEWQQNEDQQNLLYADNTNGLGRRLRHLTTTSVDTIDPGPTVTARNAGWNHEGTRASLTDANDNPNTNRQVFGWTSTVDATFTETGWTGAVDGTYEKEYPLLRKTMMY